MGGCTEDIFPVLSLASGSSALSHPLFPTTVGFFHPQGLEPQMPLWWFYQAGYLQEHMGGKLDC